MTNIKFTLSTLIIAILLTGCVTFKGNDGKRQTHSLFSDDIITRTVDADGKTQITTREARTDRTSVWIALHLTDRETVGKECLQAIPTACAYTYGQGGHIWMIADKDWQKGNYLKTVTFKFERWNDISKYCGGIFGVPVCTIDNEIYTYEHSINDSEIAYVGDEIAKQLGLDETRTSNSHTLGHEVWHLLKYDDVFIFPWNVNDIDGR